MKSCCLLLNFKSTYYRGCVIPRVRNVCLISLISFSDLNELNLSLQSTFVTVFLAHEKTEANVKKNQFWEKCVKKEIIQCFPTLHDFCV